MSTAFATINESPGLRAQLKALQEDGITFESIAQTTGVHRTTISQYVNKGVLNNPAHLAALQTFVEKQRAVEEMPFQVEMTVSGAQTVGFWQTEEYMAAMGWCHYIYTKRKMGVIVGAPGVGKTTLLKQFAAGTPGCCVYIEAVSSMRVGDLINAIARQADILLEGSVHHRFEDLVEALRIRNDVTILIDEAEYLRKWNVEKLEILRKIWDNTGTPVIMAGTPELEKLLTKGTGRENLAQLYRRKYELQLKGISEATALKHLRQYNLTPDAAQMLSKIGADAAHGGLGNLVEILELCLEAAEGGQVTMDMVREAKRYKLMY